jgi:outer membrane immunogenic protein
MLCRVLLSMAGAFALTGAALAADLPSQEPPPVYVPPLPLFSWTGFYAGVNAGYHWGNSSFNFTGTDSSDAGLGTAVLLGAIPVIGAHGANGFIGGGQIGYNYQINSIVLGLELDVDGASGRNSENTLTQILDFVPISSESKQRLNWLGTLRGRVGWTPIDRLLIYGTGGLAFGQSIASFAFNAPSGDPPLSVFASNSAIIGWAAGGGVEYALPYNWSNWSIKVEYLHYDLGRMTDTVFYEYEPNFSTLTGKVRHNGEIVRAGLNYRFNLGPSAGVVAKY